MSSPTLSGNHWTTFEHDGRYFVALVDETWHVVRSHPIGFETVRDAERAAARLNARDELMEMG